MNTDTILILHGWGGNKPAHWQEHLYAALQGAGVSVHYPKFPNPTEPNLIAWLDTLNATLTELTASNKNAPVSVVTHSLGAITWMHYAATAETQIADRVLLVAPPYVIPDIPPTDAPPGVGGFFPPPLSPEGIAKAARETHIIATNDDDYATFEQSKTYADRLNIPIHLLKDAGHISPYWGYGEWQWIQDWCLRNAELPPQPKQA